MFFRKEIKMDRFEFEDFILNIDYENEKLAREISNKLKNLDLEHFYYQLLDFFKEADTDKSIISTIDFLIYIFGNQKYIPGYNAITLCDKIIDLKDFSAELINKMSKVDNVYYNESLLQFFDNRIKLFDEQELHDIEIHILENKKLLIHEYIIQSLYFINLEDIIKKVISTNDFLLIWGMMQHFIDTIDPALKPYLKQIEENNIPILNERVKRYEKCLYLQEQLTLENRIDFNNEESEFFNNDEYDFSKYYSRFIDNETDTFYSIEKINEIIPI